MSKIINVKGCVCYLKKASNINKSNRKIYINQTAKEKLERGNKQFFQALPRTQGKKRVLHLHKKGLIK